MPTRVFHRLLRPVLACLRRSAGSLSPTLRPGLWAGVGLLVAGWSLSRADIVILKDGFTLQGTVKRERTPIVEHRVLDTVPKNNYFQIDDGARVTGFSHRQVQSVERKASDRQADPLRFDSRFVRLDNFRMPPGHYADVSPWNAKWDRVLTYDSATMGRIRVPQHLSVLTPHFAKIDARRYNWSPCYLTREFEPETVAKLLLDHPQLKMKGDASDARKRFRIFQFFVRAGWYDRAAGQLDAIQHDFPDQKDKVAELRENLQKIVASELVDLIDRGHKAGRHQWVQARLAAFPQQGADEPLLAHLRTLQATYATGNQNVDLARRLLTGLTPRVLDGGLRRLFSEAAAAIATELNLDTVNRLEAFLTLAQQAERDEAHKRTPANSPEQLLALAVTGWLLGSGAAEAKPETAQRLWRARQFVLTYQRTHGPAERQQFLTSYRESVGVAFDELAQMLRLLPPAEPFEPATANNGPWAAGGLPFPEASLFWALCAAQQLLPAAHFELRADLPWSFRTGPSYLLQLPPEYHLGRDYPVLIVLHQSEETPADMLRRWSGLAAEHGYLLAAPEWESGLGGAYHYSPLEHRAVLDVLRDLRRRFQVDSDRVFLAGFGQGANMAFDVGLSHPDLFAGVAPIGGAPHYFAREYWHNAQYLPFYVVEGDQNGDETKASHSLFDHWLSSGYPALDVVYKGRGVEWFPAELPYLFDWMGRKKRATAFPQLGKNGNGGAFGEEFQTMRRGDNRFYWVAGDGLSDHNANEGARWNNRVLPATTQASIGSHNQINVNIHGFRHVTLWLGPGMIDFDKPVNVYVNSRLAAANRKVHPSLATLLEDFYLRGDRQRLFYAKLELDL